jgi:hypothetical protein
MFEPVACLALDSASATSGARMNTVSSAPSARASAFAWWNGSRFAIAEPVSTVPYDTDSRPEGPFVTVLPKNAASTFLAMDRARPRPI